VIDDEAEQYDDEDDDLEEGSVEFPDDDLPEDDTEEPVGHATMPPEIPKVVTVDSEPPKRSQQSQSSSTTKKVVHRTVELTETELSTHGVASLFANLKCYKDVDFSCEHPLLKLAQETRVSLQHGTMPCHH